MIVAVTVILPEIASNGNSSSTIHDNGGNNDNDKDSNNINTRSDHGRE